MQALMNPRVIAGLTLLILIAYGSWVTGAPNNRLRPVDAVVVHAGGEGERLELALELMERQAAPTLVLMRGTNPDSPDLNAVCDAGSEAYEVVCPTPDPDTTIGEAQALRLLVNQRGWDEIIAVTSDYHLRRATHLDRECNPGLAVYAQRADSDLGLLRTLQRTIWEMGGMIQAAFTC